MHIYVTNGFRLNMIHRDHIPETDEDTPLGCGLEIFVSTIDFEEFKTVLEITKVHSYIGRDNIVKCLKADGIILEKNDRALFAKPGDIIYAIQPCGGYLPETAEKRPPNVYWKIFEIYIKKEED